MDRQRLINLIQRHSHPLEPLPLAGTGDVHPLPDGEQAHIQLRAGFHVCTFVPFKTELPHAATRLHAGLGQVPGHGAIDATRLTGPKGHLQTTITVSLRGLHLGDPVRLHFNH